MAFFWLLLWSHRRRPPRPRRSNSRGGESAAERQKLAKITEAQARATALRNVKGKVTSVELENEHGGLVYSVDVQTDSGKVEVQIDAGTGVFLGVERDDDDHEGHDDKD